MSLRTFGVRGKNLPTKKTLTVTASDFLIGGILAFTERRYYKAFDITSIDQFQQIFGDQIDSSVYGPDAINGFFANTKGSSATLYVQSLLGYDGSDIDAVVASRDVEDAGGDTDAYTVEAAYEEELEYGTSGNRTGTKFTLATRFSTLAAETVASTDQEYAVLDSVSGMRVGDIVEFTATGGTAATIYKKITNIVESENKIEWSGDFDDTEATTLAVDDTVSIPGFTVQTYRKSYKGVEKEVETDLGSTICSSESAVTDFYVGNVHSSNKYVKITENSASSLEERLPVADSAVTYPTNGEEGTVDIDSDYQDYFLANFDTEPIRFLANPETTDTTVQKALETYSKSRTQGDNPIVIYNIVEDRTQSQLITIGNKFQRSDEVTGIIAANWLEIDDPFTDAQNAPYREVPNVGHIMGLWIRSIDTLGIHFVPATQSTPIWGCEGVVGDQFLNDEYRTKIAEAGINVIQEKSGIGILLANCRTPSTATAFAFGNGILMRNYIKVSAVDSLAPTENTPNSINRLRASKMAITTFLQKMWLSGSTGSVAEGETFGQYEKDDGSLSTADDAFQVSLDPIKNSRANLELGRRDIDTYFTYPAPAESILIGVGILLS